MIHRGFDLTSISHAPGFTVREAAKRFRVSPDKIRAWIRNGELRAINTSSTRCGKPRFVILHDHLAEFEQGRLAGPPAQPKPMRRQPRATKDYFPDL
jgi:excisionase family DNA binding protein